MPSLALTGRANSLPRWLSWWLDAVRIEEWWSKLTPATRRWLIDHNGQYLPPAVIADIAWAGAAVNADQWWIDRSTPDGFLLSDAAADWIEAVGNQECPQP